MKQGIKLYFEQYKFKNTTLENFISCLQEALDENEQDFDLEKWVHSWLNKAGVNELQAIVTQNEASYNVSII